MMALYNIGRSLRIVDHCPSKTLVEHFGYKLFATYWNGRSKCKPKISKTINEC